MKQVDYRIISAYTAVALVLAVNKCLRDGWVCQGGICVDGSGAEFYQAVVR